MPQPTWVLTQTVLRRSLGQQDAFDAAVVAAGDQKLLGAVVAGRSSRLPGAEDAPRFIQVAAQILGNVRHRVEIDRPALENPLDDLAT